MIDRRIGKVGQRSCNPRIMRPSGIQVRASNIRRPDTISFGANPLVPDDFAPTGIVRGDQGNQFFGTPA